MMSPYSVNIYRLTAAFSDADIMENFSFRRAFLTKLEPGGQLDIGKNGANYAFYKSCDLAFDDPQCSVHIWSRSHLVQDGL